MNKEKFLMNKEKLKFLPNNLFISLPVLGTFMFIFTFTNLPTEFVLLISTYMYILDTNQQTENDYLEDRIKKLEEANLKSPDKSSDNHDNDDKSAKIKFTEEQWNEAFKIAFKKVTENK